MDGWREGQKENGVEKHVDEQKSHIRRDNKKVGNVFPYRVTSH